MPMIDVYAPEGVLPTEVHRHLAVELTRALLRAEGAPATDAFLNNIAAYVHVLPASAVHTAAAEGARTVRVQVLTPPGALPREAQRTFVAEATDIVTAVSGHATQRGRTWVLLTEAADGGWGIAGTAFGRAEFAAARG